MVNLTSYDRVMAVLNGKRDDVDRVPCINSVGTYTLDFMKIYNAFWPAAHKNPEKMAKLASAAHRLCGLDNVSVPFDMTVEAEVLGAPINFHKGRVKYPSVREFIVKDPSDLKFAGDVSGAGRVPVILEAIKILKKEFGGKVPVNAYITPPFTSISSFLVDTIMFLKWLNKEPNKIHELLSENVDLYAEITVLYQDAGADIITFHEMGGSNDTISPRHFDEFVKPYLKEIVARLKVPTILNICGSTLLIVDKMVACGANAISVDERTSISKAKQIVNQINLKYPIIGNVSSYGIIHKGPLERIRDAVKRAIDDGVDMVAPGCDFWLKTPTKHIKTFVDAVVEYGTPPPWRR